MKRKFEDLSKSESDKENKDILSENKKQRLISQKVGEYIVDAKQAFSFQLGKLISFNQYSASLQQDEDASKWQPFYPLFVHQMFGEKERINGYEGLNIEITFSAKRLIPLVQISYQKKAPAFANVDNVSEMLKKHFGKVYEDAVQFQTQVLKEEVSHKLYGEVIEEFKIKDNDYLITKVSLEDDSFNEQSFQFQAILPFFIDAASVIEPCPFWKYYLVYEKKSQNLVGFATVFEAHQTAIKFRAKISQVIVLPPYQGKGLGSKLYEKVYTHYKNEQANCIQIIVEDSADDFQKIQDLQHCREYLQLNKDLVEKINKQPVAKCILTANGVRELELSKQNLKKYSKELKLTQSLMSRIHELILYSFISKESEAHTAYREMVEKRFYKFCVMNYPDLFRNALNKDKNNGLTQPYVFNDLFESDPFGLSIEGQEEEKKESKGAEKEGGVSVDKMLVEVAAETQLKQMFDEQVEEFEKLKQKVSALIN